TYRGHGDHARRRRRRAGVGLIDGSISEFDTRGISGAAGGDRLLPLRASRCVDRSRLARRVRNSRRHLSGMAWRLAANRRHITRRSSSVTDDGLILSAREVRRDYAMAAGLVHAVRGVSLDVRRGAYVAILGAHAFGK